MLEITRKEKTKKKLYGKFSTYTHPSWEERERTDSRTNSFSLMCLGDENCSMMEALRKEEDFFFYHRIAQ